MGKPKKLSMASDMERRIRDYMEGCCEADEDKIASCLTSDCVHYFPPGMYGGAWHGARHIAQRWCEAVDNMGSYWTVDRLLVSPADGQAVIEWTHFKTRSGTTLRGAEWYFFDETTGMIKEIRAYYASPQVPDLKALELEGFDYEGQGYPMAPPPGARPSAEEESE